MQSTRKYQEVKKINDIPFQQVQNLFHRNRMFMMQHNIVPPKNKSSFKKQRTQGQNAVSGGGLTNETLQKIRDLNKSIHINIGDNIYGADSAYLQNQNQSKSYLQNDDQSSDHYAQKLHELLSTQESFTKHFVSSDQRMNKQIQIDYDKQKQRLMYGSISMSKTLNPNKNRERSQNSNNKQPRDQMSMSFYQERENNNQINQNIKSNAMQGQGYYAEQDQYPHNYNDHLQEHSIQFELEKPKQNGIHQDSILYPKSPSFSFDLYSTRKDLFKPSKVDVNSNEYRFNNFFMQKPDNQHTMDIKKQINRKYEVFDCQMSEIKYDNVCEIYQRNTFSNLLTKCLVDYNREGKETDRVYYPVQRDIPATDLEVENIIKGRQLTSPHKRAFSPNIKRSLGREKKINFYANSVLCQPPNQSKELKSQNRQRRYHSAQRGGGSQTLQIQTPTQGGEQLLNQASVMNKGQHSKQRLESNNQRSQNQMLGEQQLNQASVMSKVQQSKYRSESMNQNSQSREDNDKRVNTALGGNNNEAYKQVKTHVNKRNPLSLFREKRRKIHQMLQIDD